MLSLRLRSALPFLCLFLLIPSAQGDEITYRLSTGETTTSQGTLIVTDDELRLLERWDGQIQPLHKKQIVEVKETGPATPITTQQMADRLRELFGQDLIRIEAQDSVVVGLVLSSPLPAKGEVAVQNFLKKAMRFMVNVEGVFERYAKQMEFPLRDLKYPLVLLIFESETDFDDYYNDTTGARGLTASGVVGFYAKTTNWLAVRMSSCDSFEVPLHEAIHQQMFNRVIQRFAPTPRWFDEGIANAFEGSGERIDSNPGKLSAEYIRHAQTIPKGISWSKMMGDDSAFFADVIAGDAYTLAWCLHWMAWTKGKEGYKLYIQELAKRKPLEELPPGAEEVLFQRCFGMTMNEMQENFPVAVQEAARKQKFTLPPEKKRSVEQKALCQYQLDAVLKPNVPGQLEVTGKIMNISPIRDMTFYLTLEFENGFYYEYVFANVKPRQQMKLPTLPPRKRIPGVPPGRSASYRVFVSSVPADSAEGGAWAKGRVPGPMTAR